MIIRSNQSIVNDIARQIQQLEDRRRLHNKVIDCCLLSNGFLKIFFHLSFSPVHPVPTRLVARCVAGDILLLSSATSAGTGVRRLSNHPFYGARCACIRHRFPARATPCAMSSEPQRQRVASPKKSSHSARGSYRRLLMRRPHG